jgi:hypothetical protein
VAKKRIAFVAEFARRIWLRCVPGRIVVAVVAELAERIWLRSSWYRSLGVGGGFAFGLLGLMLVEHAFEERDGIAEGVIQSDQEVDVVKIFLAAETVGEVVAWVDGGAHFAAIRAEEAEVALAHLRLQAVAAQRGDRT